MFSSLFSNEPKTIRILLIDDTHGALKLIRKILESTLNGVHHINFVIDEFQRFDDFEKKRKKYDIAIVDWNLSNHMKKNGDTVCNIIMSEGCKNIAIASGMYDDSIIITKFVIPHGIEFIGKGDKNFRDKIIKFVEGSIADVISRR